MQNKEPDPSVLASLPKVDHMHWAYLEAIPTVEEIRAAVFSLGPDRAPGPDGVTARFLQQFWAEVGPIVTSEILRFFQTGVLPSSVARSNLVLIPKKDKPERVTDYRPISVCNVVYKVISKILASRLKGFIPTLVGPTQSAFTTGREISDNVILLREILHSFKQPSFRDQAFCLKSDLAKAFDKMKWDFIQGLLPQYGLPPLFCGWIMSCICSAEFTILFDGAGDGFFKPERGLRQGCALSPYIFILCMNLLSLMMEKEVRCGQIQGVRLARSAPVLTNIMYADDLLILGQATPQEVERIKGTLYDFCEMSGQRVAPAMSKLWFSRATPSEVVEGVCEAFQAGCVPPNETYLGCPIDAANPCHFSAIIEKIESRLNMWKARILSQAGKVILIRSVIESTLLYYMTSVPFPKTVISQILSAIKRFFWGKEKGHYLAYLRWSVITAPRSSEGLGVRDLQCMNSALMMKSL